ncbi:HepT-like ribonuclease domain-containing protein [Cellulomonas sp. KH9]|uniref:HepT-like ribonuclease domain-containing protein n=1 Tax=Cellulomonas sp. KH9 TaxID=1855324 RepID=UPI000B7DA70F
MRPDVLFVAEMIGAATRIIALTADRDARAVEQDATVRDALPWNFAVLGEAANQVSQATRDQHPDVPWRQAAGMRAQPDRARVLVHRCRRSRLDGARRDPRPGGAVEGRPELARLIRSSQGRRTPDHVAGPRAASRGRRPLSARPSPAGRSTRACRPAAPGRSRTGRTARPSR